MKINKKVIAVSAYLIVVVLVVATLGFLIFKSNKAWEDSTTWYTEQKLTLPQVAKDLNVTLDGDIGSGDFSFSTPYCMLYEIKQTERNATLKCSLLPYYYTIRQGEVPKDWSENSDIALVINQNDAEPQDFLGRLDKSYASVSALGSNVYPVSMSVKGSIVKPTASFFGKLEHLRKVYAQEKDQYIVTISTYKVSKLGDRTNAQKAQYAKEWKVSVEKELNNYVKTTESAKLTSQPFLNTMRDALRFERLKCSGLEKCEYEYKRNAAEKFIYTVYNWESSDKKAFASSKNTMLTSLYPFSEVRKGNQGTGAATCATCSPDWTELSAYTFPICPINDVVSGKNSQSSELFSIYVSKFLTQSLKIPKSQKEAVALIDAQFKLADFAAEGSFERDLVDSVNLGCYYLLKNGVTENSQLKKTVLDTYFAMLSMSIGKKIEPNSTSINSLIYESTTFSPYKTSYISDQSVTKFRETFIEPSAEAANAYTEWRSLLHTTILLYLTNGAY